MRAPLLLTAVALALVLPTVPAAQAQLPGQADPFPDHAELVERLEGLAAHPWVTLRQVGASGQGRAIHVVEVVDPSGSVPVEDRVVTLLLTQQHGNEPAGTPAALRLLDNLTAGAPQADWLANQVLLILPMANPDGAEVDQRANAGGIDVNRDHIALETPEASAIHDALNAWDVHVALDHHEYGGTGLGNPVPVRVYDYDLTTLFPVHGNVRGPAVAAASELMYDAIWPEAAERGFSANEYGEQTVNGEPVGHVAGGPDPGILRNHLGLHNVAGLLVETRVDAHPNPFQPPERRIQIHTAVMEAALEHVHANAERYVGAKQAARQAALLFPARLYEEGESTGGMPEAFAVPAEHALRETIHAHGLPTRNGTGAGEWLVPLAHELQGHGAALVHPASSRAITQAARATALDAPGETIVSARAGADEAPGLGAPAALLAGAVLAVAMRGRRATWRGEVK